MTPTNPSYIPRTLEAVIAKAAARFTGVIVTGPRGAGKRTLLAHVMNGQGERISLDSFHVLELARATPETFFRQHPLPLLIGEFQKVPDLALELKTLLDERDARGAIWLTSTQELEECAPISEALFGRVTSFELLPLSLYEMQGKGAQHKPFLPNRALERGTLTPLDPDEIWRIIWQGSWPQVINASPERRDAFYLRLLEAVLAEDILPLGIRHLQKFEKFLRNLAARVGQEFVIGEVQKETGIAAETARAWLRAAVAAGIVFQLPAFPEKTGKLLVRKPKLYFKDTGLAAWLCQIPDSESLRRTHNAEAIFKNFVVMELLKSWQHNGKKASFSFYRDTRRRKIDLLIHEGDTYYPIEIKATDVPRRDLVRDFGVLEGGTFKRGPGAVICTCPEKHFLTSNAVALPVWAL